MEAARSVHIYFYPAVFVQGVYSYPFLFIFYHLKDLIRFFTINWQTSCMLATCLNFYLITIYDMCQMLITQVLMNLP